MVLVSPLRLFLQVKSVSVSVRVGQAVGGSGARLGDTFHWDSLTSHLSSLRYFLLLVLIFDLIHFQSFLVTTLFKINIEREREKYFIAIQILKTIQRGM